MNNNGIYRQEPFIKMRGGGFKNFHRAFLTDFFFLNKSVFKKIYLFNLKMLGLLRTLGDASPHLREVRNDEFFIVKTIGSSLRGETLFRRSNPDS